MTQEDPQRNFKQDTIIPEDYPFWLRAPFRLLTDVTQFRKLDPWDFEIADLIARFVEQMKTLDDINFPVLGRAILSASILYRTKVNDLIRIIETTDDNKEDLEALGFEIPEISPSYHISQRPVTFNELVFAFQGLLKQEARYKQRLIYDQRKALIQPLQLPAEPVKIVDEESTKIAMLKKDIYRDLVKLYEKYKRPILFEELIKPNTSRIQIIRIFLCILFLSFELKAEIIQIVDLGKISLKPIRDNEEEFLGDLEKIIVKKLKEGRDEDQSVTISEIEYGDDDFLEESDELFQEELEALEEEEFED
ncbi:MAG: hypothetical protein EAX90_00285 [Candidatus Heimdallarchaeota archaeon]|nr:hypothetical protein [Candidatus Heimdallarchaeota archaeon]